MGCWLLRGIAVSDFAAGAGARSVGKAAGVALCKVLNRCRDIGGVEELIEWASEG